ncbi:hypothetical protein [Maribacter sp. 4G9]|uniref:hypothetical protein n=1 Tax=Maribacter sp. 4G9 TaxID=1889777 RepID=UPI000C14F93E|nr:hypothetical protein [Maribacter sp. 4G9]PIB27867.1 hypothetical protein BFP75_06270 [Maribacter sp. 4G9]
MNEKEDYFRISKNGHVHTLSNQIPFKWKEMIIWTSTTLFLLIYFLGIGVGIFVAFLTWIGYMLYRFAAWIYHSELNIDEKSGKIIQLKKTLGKTRKINMITEKFDPERIEYLELIRSGKTKFLLNYRTHKDNVLLILKSKTDKDQVEKYISEKIKIHY